MAFSHDGALLAAGDSDGSVVLWNVAQRKQVRSIALDGPVRCLAFAPSGKFLAGNGKKAAVVVWEVATGSEVTTFGEQQTRCLAFSPDGRWLVTGDFDNCVRFWDASTGAQKGHRMAHQTAAGPLGFVFGVAVCHWTTRRSASTRPAMAISGTLWDPGTESEKRRLSGHMGYVAAVAFAPDGKTLVSGGGDHSVRLWDAATGKEITPARSSGGPIAGLSLAADGKTLAMLGSGGNLELWNLAGAGSGEPLTADLAQWQGHYRAATFTSFLGRYLHSRVVIAVGAPRLVEMATNKNVLLCDDTAGPLAPLVFMPDGRTLIGGRDHYIVRRSLPGSTLSDRADRIADRLFCLAVSRDGRAIAAGGGDLVRALERRMTSRFSSSLPVRPLLAATATFSADGRTVIQGALRSSLIEIWEFASGKLRKQFGGHPGWVRSLAYSPDGKLLAAGNHRGAVLRGTLTDKSKR